MSAEDGFASLHAGLIERARPRNDAPGPVPADVAVAPPAAPMPPASPPAARPVFGLRGTAAEARPATVLDMVDEAPPAAVVTVEAQPFVPRPPARKRFGLTVRVDGEVRERLRQMAGRSGRTNQSILHEALLAHLDGQGGRPAP